MQVSLRNSLILILMSMVSFAFSASAVEVEVKVFEKGVNAIDARTKALENAEQRGFAAIIKQKAPNQAEQILKDYKNYDISQYILGYHAKNEAVTNTSYRAVMVLDFDDAFISNVIQQPITNTSEYQTPVPYSYDPTNLTGHAVLVLPVIRTPQGIKLWEEGNHWRQYVNEMILQQGQGEFVAPYGDPTDRLSVNSGNVTTANFSRLAPLIQRYGANRALIAVIHQRGSNGYGLTLREVSPSGDSLNIEHIPPMPDMNSRELMQHAATLLVQGYLNNQHKMQNPQLAKQAEMHEVEARINLNNARDWGELRTRLKKIEAVKNMQVMGADANGMTLQIAFQGTPREFGQALVDNGISASQNNQKLWLALR